MTRSNNDIGVGQMPSSRIIPFRLFDVFSPIGVPLYAFGRRKHHSASFLNSHHLSEKQVFDKMKKPSYEGFSFFLRIIGERGVKA